MEAKRTSNTRLCSTTLPLQGTHSMSADSLQLVPLHPDNETEVAELRRQRIVSTHPPGLNRSPS